MRKRWKRSFVTALSMALAVGNCIPAMAAPTGWRESESGWQYVNPNGSVQKGWFQDTNGEWYFLDYSTGVMKTGWIKPADGNWYFLDYNTGAMKTGWIKPADGNWYYLNPVSNGTKGAMKTGWVQTPDSKWYYLDTSTGAMKTGKITVGDQIWTLDANGAWDGKAATTVTYVSSSSGSRRPSKPSNPDTPENPDDTLDYVLDEETGILTINKGSETTYDFEGREVTKLIIAETVGDGDVTIENLNVTGDTEINGGGSSTVKFNKCKLNAVKTAKKIVDDIVQPLHIEFGEGTEVAGNIETAECKVLLTINVNVVIPKIITQVPIVIDGGGTVKAVTISSTSEPIQVVFKAVTVTEVEAGANVEIKVDNDAKVEGNITGDVVITGDGEVAGYYSVKLIVNENEGYWEIEDVDNKEAEPVMTPIFEKVVKIEKEKAVGSVLETEDFKAPDSKVSTKEFDTWYIDEDATEAADMASVYEDGTVLYAGWKDKEISTYKPTITGLTATVSGSTAAATVETSETGTTATFTISVSGSAAAASGLSVTVDGFKATATVDDKEVTGTVTGTPDTATVGKAFDVVFKVEDTDDAKYEEVTISVIINVTGTTN